jgi:hypothetical protein
VLKIITFSEVTFFTLLFEYLFEQMKIRIYTALIGLVIFIYLQKRHKMNNKSIQTEVDASFLYQVLADNEKDPGVKAIFLQMSEIEKGHALSFLKKSNQGNRALPGPSRRALVLKTIGRILGYDFVLSVLLDTEKSISASILNARKKTSTPGSLSDTAHVKILENILGSSNMSANNLARFETRHRSVGGNALRAAVLGGNDGLVSNFSLVMGITGASSGQKEVMLAGLHTR